MINVDNISEYVYPLIKYIKEWNPDYVLVCDTGARIFGLATYILYTKKIGTFPTLSKKIDFRKISGKSDYEDLKEYLEDYLSQMSSINYKSKVLVLDDWVHKGRTKRLIKEVFSKQNIQNELELRFAVLQGLNADFSCNESITSNFAGTVDWHNKDEIIGIEYSEFSPIIKKNKKSIEYRNKLIYKILEN